MSKRFPNTMVSGIEHKHCCTCGEWKPLPAFHDNATTEDGKQPYCANCKSEHNRKTRQQNNHPFIYGLYSKSKGKIVYVGLSEQTPAQRKAEHKAKCFNMTGKAYKHSLYNFIRKVGWDDIDLVVLNPLPNSVQCEAFYEVLYDTYRNETGFNIQHCVGYSEELVRLLDKNDDYDIEDYERDTDGN